MKNRQQFIAGVAILLWGWQHDLLWLAVPMSVIAEIGWFINSKWELSKRELNIISDSCTLIYVVLLVVGIIVHEGPDIVYFLLTWLPVSFFPLILLVRYSNWSRLPLSVLSISARRNPDSNRTIDILFPYVTGCIIAASIPIKTPYILVVSVMLLCAWLLLPFRSKRIPLTIWSTLFLTAMFLGLLTHNGLKKSQLWLEEVTTELIQDWLQDKNDPFQNRTALGSIGELNGSSSILLRVELPLDVPPPVYLQKASYDTLINNNWHAHNKSTTDLTKTAFNEWMINSAPGRSDSTLTIHASLDDKKGLLSIPSGSKRIRNIFAESIKVTELGTLQVNDASPALSYEVSFDFSNNSHYPPKKSDLFYRAFYKGSSGKYYNKTLKNISDSLGLKDVPDRKKIEIIKEWFRTNFRYTLDLERNDRSIPPIEDFLINTRKGHCEYFAASTVLLLRYLGIPSRYQTGFVVQEYSNIEERYVVRGEHAHAWARAWVNGHWINVDTTPPGWSSGSRSGSGSLRDYLSYSWFVFNQWRQKEASWLPSLNWLWLAVPLVMWVLWKFRKRRKSGKQNRSQSPYSTEELKSYTIYPLLEHWEKSDITPADHCSLKGALQQIYSGTDINVIEKMSLLHYRERFSSKGLNKREKSELEALVKTLTDAKKPH